MAFYIKCGYTSEIMTTDKPFGGISIIAVGDLSQLLPIGQKPVYDFTSDPIAALAKTLSTDRTS
jgi:hypothetical protein